MSGQDGSESAFKRGSLLGFLQRWTARHTFVVVALAIMGVSIAAYIVWDPFGPTQRKWTEDVDLGDGRVIQAERSVTFNETNSWSGDSYNAVETESTIRFTGELSHLPPWSEPLMALVLYQDQQTKEWVVVAVSSSCTVWNARGRPQPPYWEFRLASDGWREVSLSPSSIGRVGNLLHRYQKKLGARHITIAKRKKIQAPLRSFDAMSPDEKKYWLVLAEVSPYSC